MPAILKNNAFSTLATGITASETSVVVTDGSQFPAVTGEEYFYATLVSQTGIVEIVKVTTRVGNTMVVVRAEDGSTASSFQAGARVEMRVNAASVAEFLDIELDIDRAINGQLTLVLTGTSSTLTTSDGVFTDNQHKMLVLSGTPSGTHTITISPNTVQKIYFVQNNTAQSVIFTQGSGGNVTILENDSAIIYCDGAAATARVRNLTANLSLAPAFAVPREYGVTGDGATDDGDNFEQFVVGAEDATMGVVPPAVYRIGNNLIDDPSNSRITAAPGAVFERTDVAQNMFTYRRPVNVDIEGMTFDGRFDTLGTPGHGLVLIDPVNVTVDRLTATNLGGIPLSTGGTGLLAYKSLNPGLDKIRVTRSNFDGAVGSTRSLGLVMVDSEFSTITESHSSNMGEWGLEFKNNANFNIMANSTGYFSRYSFGIGSDALPPAHNNVFSALTSKDSDSGLTIGQGINNVIVGLSAHADAQPNTFANNQAYGLHLEASAHENIAIGVLASGTIMDYPVRIRGNRNVVSIADYSDAPDTVTFNAGAVENYVEILHIGEKANSVSSLIADLNSPNITRGDGANVIDSPLTREYYNSITNNFKWSMAGYTTTYAHFSTSSFVFDGYGGSSILGLGVGADGNAGLSVSDATTGGVGSLLYANVATPYWRFNVGGVQTLRIDTTKISPATSGGINLGGSTLPFGQLWTNYVNTGTLDVNGTIDTTGFVEVGILGTGDRASAVDFHSSGLPNTINYSARILRNAGINGALSTYNTGTGNIVWWINDVAKMTLEGTTGKLYLTGSGSRATSGWVVCSSNDSIADAQRFAGYIQWTTDIGAIGTNYFVSDIRKKDNVAPSVQSSADLINQIDFIQFDWKPDSGNTGHVDVGVSAQQLQGIDTRLVNELSDGGLMVNEPALVAHMAKALQEALAKITALEARITALEA